MRSMLKVLFSLALCCPLAAQTINPNQIRPSGTSGQVLTTVTANQPPQWAAGAGVTPGAQYLFPYYSGSGTGTALGPSNIFTDATGNNLTIPGQLNWYSSGSPAWNGSVSGGILNFSYVGSALPEYANFLSAIQATYIQGPSGSIRFRPSAGNVDDVLMALDSPAGTLGTGWLQNVDVNGFANMDFNPESSSSYAVPTASGLVWWLTNSSGLSVTVTRPGTGYSGTGTCTLSGGAGSGDTCTATVVSGGISVAIVGSGTYTVPPTLSISGFTGGTGFSAQPYLANPNSVSGSFFYDPVALKFRLNTGSPRSPSTDLLTVDTSGNTSVAAGSNIVYRCTTAGTLPTGALTITTADCTASTDTGLRVK